MAVAEMHPSAEELAAFTLGTLSDGAHAAVEARVAACTSCQGRAAVAPGDALVELRRRAHARTGHAADTVTEAAAHAPTPAPLAADVAAIQPAPTVSLAAPASQQGTGGGDSGPLSPAASGGAAPGQEAFAERIGPVRKARLRTTAAALAPWYETVPPARAGDADPFEQPFVIFASTLTQGGP